MNKIIKYLIMSALVLQMYGCKDEKLTLQRVPYTGNEIRTDGYYYHHWASSESLSINKTATFFLYRNGIKLTAGSYGSIDLDIVEKEMLSRYELLVKQKIGWGVFVITGNKVEYEEWTTSAGGGLPIYKNSYNIENDTTLMNPEGKVYHFKQFSPKPDSTIANKWIK